MRRLKTYKLHEGGEPHKHPHDPPKKKSKDQEFQERWNLEQKLNQGIDNTFHIVNQRPLLGLDGTDPDAEYKAWIASQPVYTRPKSMFDYAIEGVIGIPDLLTKKIPDYLAETAEDAYDQFKKTSFMSGPMQEDVKQIKRDAKQRILDTVTPWGYSLTTAAREYLTGNRAELEGGVTWDDFENHPYIRKMPADKVPFGMTHNQYAEYVHDGSDEAFERYLYPERFNDNDSRGRQSLFFNKSYYKPTNAKNKNAKYLQFSRDDDIWDAAINNDALIQDVGWKGVVKDHFAGAGALENFTLSKGYDKEVGYPYISYYDKYDFDKPFVNAMVGNPFEIYGRMYYDPKTKNRVFPERFNKKDGGPIEDELTYPEGYVPMFAPGGVNDLGDKLKRFARKFDNTGLTLNWGKLNPQTFTYVPTVGLNTLSGSNRKGWWDSDIKIGGDKDGLSTSVGTKYFGPFWPGQRTFQGSVDGSAFYDQGHLGTQLSAGVNIPLGYGRSNRGKELRGGRFQFDLQPFRARIGARKDYNRPAYSWWTQLNPNEEPTLMTSTKGFDIDWGYGAKLDGKYRLKKLPIELFGSAEYSADMVRNAQLSAEQYEPDNVVAVQADNPNDNPYVGGDSYITLDLINYGGGKDREFKPDHKFNFNIGAKLLLDDINFKRSRAQKKIKELEENDPFYNPGIRVSNPDEVEEEYEEQEEIKQEDGGFILELDEEAAKRFAEGGYILEELEEGGEDDNLITYKNNKNLIDSVANWDMQSDVDISSDYNDQIKARLLTGKFGFNPKTGELVKLRKSQQTKVTDKEALETTADLTSTKREDAKQKLMDDYTANRKLVSIDKANEWNPSFVIKDEYGRDINTQDFAGKQVYMTDAEEEAYKKARIGHNALITQQQMNTAFSIPAAFTPAGLGIMGMQGAAHMTQDVPELINDPSLANAGKVFVDALMVSPLVLPSAISTAKNIKNVKLPYPKMDLNKLGSYPIPKEALPTTVKGTKDYIKNFKPKQTLQLESSDMKFDRVLKDMTRQDTPTLARNFSGVEFDKNLLGLKNENRVLGDYGEIYGRRTKHFSGTGAGAHIGGMNAGYNTTFLGNIDDIKKASGSHLREISPTDTYFYNSDNVFKLTNKGVYLTSDPATYQRLYNAGKTVKFEPNLMDGSHSNLSKYIGDDASILKSFDSYITNPSNRGSLMPTVYKNKTTAFPSSMNSSAAHSYDILADLETLERLPLFNQFITKNKLTGNTKLSSYMTKAGELGPGEFATDYTYFNQWINLPKKVREAELQKVKNFYESNVKTGKLSESALGIRYENNLKQYQTDYKKIIDQLEDLHKNAGPGLKYKKGGSIEAELTDEEVEQYKARGYVLEELVDGGEDDKKKKSRKENRKENEQQVANWANRSSYFEHRSDGTPITIEDKVNKFLQSLEDQRARDEAAGTDIISTSGYKYGNWKDRRKYKKFIKSTMDDIHAEAEHQYLYKNDPTYRGKYNLATKEKTKKYKNPNYVFDDPKTKVNEELLYLTKADADPEFTPESKYLYQFADVDVAQNAGAQKTLNKRRDKAKMMNHIFAELQGYGELPSGYGDEAWGEYVTAYENATKKAKNILAYEKAAKDVKKGRLSTHDFHALYRKRGWAEYDPKNVKEDVKGLWKIQMELIDEKKRQKFADELNMGAHLSGIPAAMNIIDNPIETGKDVLYTAADIAYQPVQPIVSAVTGNDKNLVTGQEMFANTDGVWDVAAVAPYAIGAYGQAKNLINLGRGSKTATATKVKPAAEYKAQNVVKGKNVSGNTPLSKSQIEDIIKERKSYLNSNEYMKRRIAQTGETEAQVRASVTQYSDDLDNVEIYFHDKPGAAGQYFPKQKNSWLERKIFGQPKYTNPTINIYNQGSPERLRNVLTHELDHLASPVGRNTSFKYPKVKSEGKYLNLTEEQHAAKNQLDRTIREDLKIKNYDPITESQFNKWQTTNPGYQRLKNPVEHGFDHVDDFVTGFQNKGGNKTQLLDFLNKGYATVPLTLGAGYSITQKDGGFVLDLDEEETKRFAAGGYVLEELVDGGEDDDVSYGPKSKEERKKLYNYSSDQDAPNMILTYKDDKEFIDGIANWQIVSGVPINEKFSDQIKARLYTGNYGYNPATGTLYNLNKLSKGKSKTSTVKDPYVLDVKKDLDATAGKSNEEVVEYYQDKEDALAEKYDEEWKSNRHPVAIDSSDAWNPSFELKDKYGRTYNTQNFAGQSVMMTDAEEAAYRKAMLQHNAPIAQQQMNNLFSIPASFTPAGMVIMGMQGAAHMAQDVPELIENPSWSNAGKVFVDAAMVAPFASGAAGKVRPYVNQAMTKLDDATRVTPGAQSFGSGTGSLVSDVRSGINEIKNVVKGSGKTNNTTKAQITKLKKDGLIPANANEQMLIDNPNLLNTVVKRGIKDKLTVNRNVFSGDDLTSAAFPEASTEALYTGSHTNILGNTATGERVGLNNMNKRDLEALYTFRGKGSINKHYGTHNIEARIPFDYTGTTDEMVTNFNNLQKSRVKANPTKVVNVPADVIKPGAIIDDVSGDGITAIVGEKGSKVLDPIKVTTDVKATQLNKNYHTANKEAQSFAGTKDLSGVNKKYNTNFKTAEEAQRFLDKKVGEAGKAVTNYDFNRPQNPELKVTNYSPFLGFEDGGFVLDLDDTEAQAYAKNGYILEELVDNTPLLQHGGSHNKIRLNIDIDAAKKKQEELFKSIRSSMNIPEVKKVEEEIKTEEKIVIDEKARKEALDKLKQLGYGLASGVSNYIVDSSKPYLNMFGDMISSFRNAFEEEQEKIAQLQKIGRGLADADWKGLSSAVMNKVYSDAQPFASSMYNVGSNIADFYDNITREVELEDEEVKDLKDQGYVVEEVPTFEKLYDPYDPKNFYSRYYKERELDQSQDALKPEYFGYTKPLNLFGQEDPDAEYEQWKAQTFKAPIRPKSMLSKLVDEAGEYVDAAKGLPKKIYDGVSKEVDEFSKSAGKALKDIDKSFDMGDDDFLKQDLDLTVDLVQSAFNKDKERFLENKYGQEIGFKMLDQYDNPDKYTIPYSELLNVVGGSGSFDENINFLRRKLDKEGVINTPEAVIESVKEKIVEVKPKPETFTEDAVDENGKLITAIDKGYSNNPLYTYRNQWDNNVGFVYKTAPTKQHRKSSDKYTDVKGVAHFLLDASVDPRNPFSHEYNKAFIEKAMANDEWIPAFTKHSDDMVRLKYKKPEDILDTDIVSTPLRQLKFSDINFQSTQTPKGFKRTVKEVTTKDGDATYLLFKNRKAMSRFSGGSVVFIFEDKYGNTIVRDFAGSINAIENEGKSITKQYDLKPGELTIGYHDVGSFSAKPKANKNNILSASQWSDYNENGWTGGALMIPIKQPISPTENDEQMQRMFPNTYNK